MKKKILILSIVAVLVAIATVGGSLAWFTDVDSMEKIYTIGSVDIEQIEEFDGPAPLMPIVHDTTTPNDYTDDANYIKKEIKVKNVGSSYAYIRTYIAIPAALDGFLHLDFNTTSDWILESSTGSTTIGGRAYKLISYLYNAGEGLNKGKLAPDAETVILLKGAYIDEKTDLEVRRDQTGNITAVYFVFKDLATGNVTQGAYGYNLYSAEGTKLDVYAVSQGIQAPGFTSAAAAFEAAFGDVVPKFD